MSGFINTALYFRRVIHTAVVPLDTETGEIKTGYILRSPAQQTASRRWHEMQLNEFKHADSRRWVAAYQASIKEISHILSLAQAGAIIKLLPYMRFKADGKLIDGGKPLKQSEIARIFKRSRSATTDILRELEDLGIIHVTKEGRSNTFYISAKFHSIGALNGERFIKVYTSKLSEVCEDLEINEVGLLYKVLPYFHFSEFYLCSNPNELEPENIHHLDRQALADAVGHDVATISSLVTKLSAKKVMLSTKSGNSVRYLVHPELLGRQRIETEWARSVRKLFDQH